MAGSGCGRRVAAPGQGDRIRAGPTTSIAVENRNARRLARFFPAAATSPASRPTDVRNVAFKIARQIKFGPPKPACIPTGGSQTACLARERSRPAFAVCPRGTGWRTMSSPGLSTSSDLRRIWQQGMNDDREQGEADGQACGRARSSHASRPAGPRPRRRQPPRPGHLRKRTARSASRPRV